MENAIQIWVVPVEPDYEAAQKVGRDFLYRFSNEDVYVEAIRRIVDAALGFGETPFVHEEWCSIYKNKGGCDCAGIGGDDE